MTFTRYELTIPVELRQSSTSAVSTLSPTATEREPSSVSAATASASRRSQEGPSGARFGGGVRRRPSGAEGGRGSGDSGRRSILEASWVSLWGDDSLDTGKSLHDRRLRSDDSLPIRRSALTFHAVSFPQYKDIDSGESPLPRRHGVGIDRTTGAASDGALYEHEIPTPRHKVYHSHHRGGTR